MSCHVMSCHVRSHLLSQLQPPGHQQRSHQGGVGEGVRQVGRLRLQPLRAQINEALHNTPPTDVWPPDRDLAGLTTGNIAANSCSSCSQHKPVHGTRPPGHHLKQITNGRPELLSNG
jgi:hypothetical protein